MERLELKIYALSVVCPGSDNSNSGIKEKQAQNRTKSTNKQKRRSNMILER